MIKSFMVILMLMSTMICMEAKGWWACWFTMEINSIALIIFMFKEKSKEKTFMFFVFQSLSSALMMVFIFYTSWTMEQNMEKTLNYTMMMSMMVKIGLFPFHGWIIKTMKSMSWQVMMILFSWQKLIPIMVMMKMFEKSKKMSMAIIASVMILNYIVIKMANTKIILTISSLIHNTWVFIPLMMAKEMSTIYLLSYTIILVPLIFKLMNINETMTSSQWMSKKMKKEMMILTFSISSIPPSISFFAKMMVLLMVLSMENKMTTVAVLLASSCIMFYVYFWIFFKYMFSKKIESTKKTFYLKKNEVKELSWIITTTAMLMAWS